MIYENSKKIPKSKVTIEILFNGDEQVVSKEYFNDKGHLVKLENYFPQGQLYDAFEYTYHKYGYITSVTEFNNIRKVVNTFTYTRTYLDNGSVEENFQNGKLTKKISVLVSDSAKLLQELTEEYERDILVRSGKVSYSDSITETEFEIFNQVNGVLIDKQIRVDTYKENKIIKSTLKSGEDLVWEQECQFEKDRIISSSINYVSRTNDTYRKEILTEVFSKGLLVECTIVVNDELDEISKYTYDADGKLLSETIVDKFKITEKKWEYQVGGAYIFITELFGGGVHHRPSAITYGEKYLRSVVTFDESGNIVSRAEYDKSGLKSSIRFEYDYE